MHGNKTVQHCFVEASSQLNEPPLYTEISRLRNGTIHSAANVRCSYDTKTCQLCIGGTFKHYPGSAIRHMQLRKLYNFKHLNRIESKDWYKRRSEYTVQIGQNWRWCLAKVWFWRLVWNCFLSISPIFLLIPRFSLRGKWISSRKILWIFSS